jgi:hypothetical protein
VSLSEHLHAWQALLADDPDREFLLDGIENGFRLEDEDASEPPPHPLPKNYRSAMNPNTRSQLEKQLREGMLEGHYQRQDSPPAACSPITAIPKPNGSVRLIHDLSSPAGACLNDFTSKDEVKF